MIKKYLKVLIITSVVILLPLVAGVALWDQLPDELPIHWNASGEVDGWGSKPLVILGAPALFLALQWIAALITQADPKRANQSEKVRAMTFWIIPLLSLALPFVIYATALGRGIPITMVASVLLGAIFVIVGNYLPKCKQSYTVGIKLPWTLHSEENWNKTHRMAGWLWVAGGILMMALGFMDLLWASLIPPLFMALVPVIYSYLLYRKGI